MARGHNLPGRVRAAGTLVSGTLPVIGSCVPGAAFDVTGAIVRFITEAVRFSTRAVMIEPVRPKSMPEAFESVICSGA